MSKYIWRSEYFCGNKISDYGLENKHVDYRTLAKAFDSVMANDLMQKTSEIGYWECCNGNEYYYEDNEGNRYTEDELQEKIEEVQETMGSIEDTESEEYNALLEKEDELKNLEPIYYDIYQWYIISDMGANILQDYTDEIVYYNEELDLYLWGVTHWGTSWDYVLTDIQIDLEKGA